MGKDPECRTCQTLRCCPDHCCDWVGCKCGDCELCGGTLSFEYSEKEREEMENEKKEAERKKVEDEILEIKRREEEEENKRKAEQEEQERKKKEAERLKEEEKAKQMEAEIEKRLEQDEKFQNTMSMIEETQRKNQEAIASINNTLQKLGDTLQGVQQTTTAMENFRNEFDNVLNKLTENIGLQVRPIHKREPTSKEMTPIISDIPSVAEEIKNFSHIVVLTGPGLSAENGLLTVESEKGLWTLGDNQATIDAFEFFKYENFRENPKEMWRWHHLFRRLVEKNSPNFTYEAIANLQAFCNQSNVKFTIITQNLDGYHVEAYLNNTSPNLRKNKEEPNEKVIEKDSSTKEESKTSEHDGQLKVIGKGLKPKPDDVEERKLSDISPTKRSELTTNKTGFWDGIYEIHGSINYMRCANNCTYKLFVSPESSCSDDYIPKCPLCQGMARPHTLFFDEIYLEHFYRQLTLKRELESMDCLILMGTTLETSLPIGIVGETITKQKLIVEVSPSPQINSGNVRQLIGDASEIVPNLCYSIQDKITEKNQQR